MCGLYNSGMKMTRRALAGLVAVPALLTEKAPAQAPATAAVEPNAARADFQSAARQLAGVKLPRSIEPATRFEA
jgi:hypothetical protein